MKSPVPLIEEHYHIADLIERQQKRADDRNYHREKDKRSQEWQQLINGAPDRVMTDFLCHNCGTEFRGVAVKQTEDDWNTDKKIAYYKHKCDCGSWCLRRITDKNLDRYWSRSKLVRADIGKNYRDTIQPHESGFNMLYKKL